jgi:hypothetical protein
VFVRFGSLVLEEVLEGPHDLSLVLGGVGQELLLVQESQVSQVGEEIPPTLETRRVSQGVQSVEDKDLVDITTDQKL